MLEARGSDQKTANQFRAERAASPQGGSWTVSVIYSLNSDSVAPLVQSAGRPLSAAAAEGLHSAIHRLCEANARWVQRRALCSRVTNADEEQAPVWIPRDDTTDSNQAVFLTHLHARIPRIHSV